MAGLWQPGLDNQVPQLALYLLHPVDGPDPAAHATQIHRPGRVAPLPRFESIEHDQLGPGAVQVHVMRVPMHRRELRPGRTGRHLGNGYRTVRAAEPLHVRERISHAERGERGRPTSWMPAYSGPLMSRGSITTHCIHGLRRTSSGGGM